MAEFDLFVAFLTEKSKKLFVPPKIGSESIALPYNLGSSGVHNFGPGPRVRVFVTLSNGARTDTSYTTASDPLATNETNAPLATFLAR